MGRPARPRCRPTSESWSSTTAARTARRLSCVRGRRRWLSQERRPSSLGPAVRAPRREGRRGPGRDARRGHRPGGLRGRGHGDTAGPDPVAGRGARGPRRRSGQPHPARRLRHASEPASATAARWAGRSTSSPRPGRSALSRTRSAGSRASPARRPTTCSTPGDHEHRVRRGGDLPRPPARLPDRDRADPLVGQARLADASRAGPRAQGCVGSAPDPHDPSSGSAAA